MVQEASALKGRTIAVTRPREQAEEAGKIIEEKGGKPYLIPTIEVKGQRDLSATKGFLDALMRNEVDYVIFMSINGARHLLNAVERLGLKNQLSKHLKDTVTVAVGPKTADELKNHGIRVDLIPENYTSEGIIQTLQQRHVYDKSIYIPRTSEAPPELAEKLRNMGNTVREIHVYRSQLPRDPRLSETFLRDLANGKIDAIIFSSSLGVKNFVQMLKQHVSQENLRELIHEKSTIVAIGPTTAKTLTEIGFRVDVMPDKHVFEEALNALARHWSAA
jgi:uroporphyrinogen-III synthase